MILFTGHIPLININHTYFTGLSCAFIILSYLGRKVTSIKIVVSNISAGVIISPAVDLRDAVTTLS